MGAARKIEEPQAEHWKCSVCLHKRQGIFLAACPCCGSMNTLYEFIPSVVDEQGDDQEEGSEEEADEYVQPRAVNASKVKIDRHNRIRFGVQGLDEVLANPKGKPPTYGAVVSSVIGLTGDPGVGKSTLVLQACIGAMRQGLRVLHADQEEEKDNIIDRARRLGATRADLKFLEIIDDAEYIEDVLDEVDRLQPAIWVVNSVNTYYAHGPDGQPLDTESGNPLQIKRISKLVYKKAHKAKATTFMLCHVNADGDMAGPKALQHAVDAQFKITKDEDFDSTGHVTMATEGHKNRNGNSRLKAGFIMDEKEGILKFRKML